MIKKERFSALKQRVLENGEQERTNSRTQASPFAFTAALLVSCLPIAFFLLPLPHFLLPYASTNPSLSLSLSSKPFEHIWARECARSHSSDWMCVCLQCSLGSVQLPPPARFFSTVLPPPPPTSYANINLIPSEPAGTPNQELNIL